MWRRFGGNDDEFIVGGSIHVERGGDLKVMFTTVLNAVEFNH